MTANSRVKARLGRRDSITEGARGHRSSYAEAGAPRVTPHAQPTVAASAEGDAGRSPTWHHRAGLAARADTIRTIGRKACAVGPPPVPVRGEHTRSQPAYKTAGSARTTFGGPKTWTSFQAETPTASREDSTTMQRDDDRFEHAVSHSSPRSRAIPNGVALLLPYIRSRKPCQQCRELPSASVCDSSKPIALCLSCAYRHRRATPLERKRMELERLMR